MTANLYRFLFRVAFVVAVALAVVLGLKNRSLRQQCQEYVERSTQPRVGLPVPSVRGLTLEGDSITIGANEPQVLFFYNTTCRYCRASLPAWNQITEQAVRLETLVYGLQLDSAHLAPAYVAEHGVAFPVVTGLDRRMARFYRVTGVPLTMVLDAEARVQYVRRGELSDPASIDSVLAAIQMAAANNQ